MPTTPTIIYPETADGDVRIARTKSSPRSVSVGIDAVVLPHPGTAKVEFFQSTMIDGERVLSWGVVVFHRSLSDGELLTYWDRQDDPVVVRGAVEVDPFTVRVAAEALAASTNRPVELKEG